MQGDTLRIVFFTLILTLSSCSKPTPIIIGNQLKFPKSSEISQYRASLDKPIGPLNRFAGSYPAAWPRNFELPNSTFLWTANETFDNGVQVKGLESGISQVHDPRPSQQANSDYWAESVVNLSPEQTASYFESQIKRLGARVQVLPPTSNPVRITNARELLHHIDPTRVRSPPRTIVSADFAALKDPELHLLVVIIYHDKTLPDWSYFTIRVMKESNAK